MNSRRELDNVGRVSVITGQNNRTSLGQQAFHRMISFERRRAERSRRAFVLMLLDLSEQLWQKKEDVNLKRRILSVLSPITRETDIIGWYQEGFVIGLVFTEITVGDLSSVSAIMNRVSQALKNHLSRQELGQLNISLQLLPENHDDRFPAVSVPSSACTVAAAPTGTESSI